MDGEKVRGWGVFTAGDISLVERVLKVRFGV